MDPELDHIICTVLSLEEDYPTMSPPLRNLNYPPSPNGELPNHLSIMNISDPNKVSNVLVQTLLELYSYLGYQQEEGNGKSINPDFSEQISKITSSRNSQENLSHNQNQKVLKRKLEEDQYERCKQPRVNIEDFQNSNSKSQCKKRTNFNEEQTAFLINEFDRNPYPSFTKRCHIAKISGVSEPRIQVWFQNRRARHLSKDMKSQIAQGSQFSTPRDLPHIVQNPYQNLQIDGQFQIPGNMWML